MTTIRDVFERLEVLGRKKTIYQMLSTRLSLLIDQAMPSEDLPQGTDSTDALLVREELRTIIEAIEAERESYFDVETDAVEVPGADAMLLLLTGVGSGQS